MKSLFSSFPSRVICTIVLILVLLQSGSSQNVGIGTDDPTHKLTLQSLSDSTLFRLIGPDMHGHGARFNYGDYNYVYIEEDLDDGLKIYAYGRTAIMGGNVGIGTVTPDAKLEVAGEVKITGGAPGDGKVLTSDATGLASWQPPAPSPGTNDPSVSICCQRWMTKNLDVATYRNGDPIPRVDDATAWAALTTGAYCYFDNDSFSYAARYGKLYNWYAVNDSRGLAPEGWYIPTDFEWTTLGTCLGGSALAGGPMKDIGTTIWDPPNTGATNLSGFTGLPGGYRFDTGVFAGISTYGLLWSSTENDAVTGWNRNLNFNDDDLSRASSNKQFGFSVRCLRD